MSFAAMNLYPTLPFAVQVLGPPFLHASHAAEWQPTWRSALGHGAGRGCSTWAVSWPFFFFVELRGTCIHASLDPLRAFALTSSVHTMSQTAIGTTTSSVIISASVHTCTSSTLISSRVHQCIHKRISSRLSASVHSLVHELKKP